MIENATDPLSLKQHRPSTDESAEAIPPPLTVITTSAQSYIQTKNYVFDSNTQLGKLLLFFGVTPINLNSRILLYYRVFNRRSTSFTRRPFGSYSQALS